MNRFFKILLLFMVVHVHQFIIPTAIAGTTTHPQNQVQSVSHEDLRDAILTLIHMFRDNTDKLERHEYRERQLGDQMKKAFSALEKKQKTEETSASSLLETLNTIKRKLDNIENVISQEKITPIPDTSPNFQQSILKKIDNIEQNIQRNELIMESIRSNSIQKLETILSNVLQSQSAINTLDQKLMQSVFEETTQLMNKLDSRLTNVESLREDLNGFFSLQQNTLDQITNIQQFINENKKKEITDYQLSNSVIQKLNEFKYDIQQNRANDTIKSQEQIDQILGLLNRSHQVVLSTLSESTALASGGNENTEKKYDELLKEIRNLSKIDQVLIQTADSILDTKRRIEYGTHQILLEVGKLIKESSKDTNDTVNRRFDMISTEILNNTNGALQNLSSKLETEISQVWRQIGIMYQTLTNSADALNKLQQQTEIYVNGSLSTMDNMEGKVGQITSRMSEVDDNLNYLLGRLSLVTQEFNQIKTGLGQALDNIRSSFHTVQDKVKDVGPGPNPIEEEGNTNNPLEKAKYTVS